MALSRVGLLIVEDADSMVNCMVINAVDDVAVKLIRRVLANEPVP